jgi:hypothetical protein
VSSALAVAEDGNVALVDAAKGAPRRRGQRRRSRTEQ